MSGTSDRETLRDRAPSSGGGENVELRPAPRGSTPSPVDTSASGGFPGARTRVRPHRQLAALSVATLESTASHKGLGTGSEVGLFLPALLRASGRARSVWPARRLVRARLGETERPTAGLLSTGKTLATKRTAHAQVPPSARRSHPSSVVFSAPRLPPSRAWWALGSSVDVCARVRIGR